MFLRIPCTLLVFTAQVFGGPAADPPGIEQGSRLFGVHCAGCHGPRGEGSRGPTLARADLDRLFDEETLLAIIRSGISGTEMPGAKVTPEQASLIAAYVMSLQEQPAESLAGDPGRGADLYATRGACAQCHRIRGQGGAIGSDLTTIGRRRSGAYLERALIDPNAEVPQSFSRYRRDAHLPQNFLFVRLVLGDGRAVAGVRINEDAFSIQIRDLAGRIHSYHKSDLGGLEKDWGRSPMPAYGAVFSLDEIDDVVAFLASLRGEEK